MPRLVGRELRRLDNNPIGIPRLLPGQKVKFKRDHIIDIWYDDGDQATAKFDGATCTGSFEITHDGSNGHGKFPVQDMTEPDV